MLFTFVRLIGQADTKHSRSHSYDLIYGYNLFTENKNVQFNTTKNFQLNLPVKFVGIGASSGANDFEVKKKKFVLAQNGYFQYYLPQTIHIDTISYKVSGFSINIGYGKALHSKNHHYNLISYLGVNAGRLLLKSKEFSKQQSIFLNPKIGIQPKIIVGAFAFSLIAEYQFDLLNSSWKNTSFKKDDSFKLNSVRQSALTFAFCIGYHVHY